MKNLGLAISSAVFCLSMIISCSSDSTSIEGSSVVDNVGAKIDSKIDPPAKFPYTFAKVPTIGKDIYIPNELKNSNFKDNSSRWSFQRSASSNNVIVFWDSGFGQYPSITSGYNLRVNIEDLLNLTEEFYVYYRDSMKFVIEGESLSNNYRMMIYLLYQVEWLATGSGYDNVIGALWITPSTTKSKAVLAHEFGHSFQYQVACDGNYGFRDQNYVGTFREQCAQYMSWQLNSDCS